MAKLHDLFTQARRAQSSGGIGFVGKNKPVTKPRAAALIVELPDIDAGEAESAIKSGADGLLFTWDGNDASTLESLKEAIDAAQTSEEKVVSGLCISGGWENLERESFEHLKELGVNYVLLPLEAPARLLSLQIKDLELAIAIPMRPGDMYPIFIRNLTAFDNISAVRLDFSLTDEISTMSIEDVLHYRAVREAVRFPAILNVQSDLDEAGAYTLLTLGVQAMILTASKSKETTQKQIKALRELLEKVHQEEKDSKVGLTSKQ
ncbi:MAG TPA: hypothetical protein VED37_07065 [Ktedonobacteraceae bacterium]|nr:hypothetical protein [Ktedonobacteraceae bacterium]